MITIPKQTLALLFLALGVSANAQNINWINTTTGDLADSANWNPAVSPGSSHSLYFSQAAADNTASLSGGLGVAHLTQSGGTTLFDLASHTFTAQTINLNASVSSGISTFQNGTISLSGNINAGGNVSRLRSTIFDNVAVSGQSATGTSLRVASASSVNQSAHVTIRGGSEFDIYSTLVGSNAGANNAHLTIEGSDTHLKSRFLQVGNSTATNSHFTLTDGSVTLQNLGTAGVQYFLVVGTGNTANLNGGQLTVTNSTGSGYIRAQAGGAININGASVRTNIVNRFASDPALNFGSGLIETERTVHAGHTLTIGDGGPNKATYRLMTKDAAVANSGEHTATLINIASNGALEGDGRIIGNVTSAGIIDPGLNGAVGLLEIDQALSLSSTSTVNLILTGTAVNEFDRILIGGNLDFDGTLNITLDGYTAALNDSFQLFEANAFSGDFTTVNFSGTPLDQGLFWSFNAGTGTLQVIPEPSSLLLLGGGLLLAVRAFRRTK